MLVRSRQPVIPTSRKGSLMPAIAIALFVVGGCLALVLNAYWLADAQEELRTATQNAALAAAHQLASDDTLKPGFDTLHNSDHVRRIAEERALDNQVSGPATAQMEVHLGRAKVDPLTGQRESIETDENPTSVVVIGHRDGRQGNPVGMIAPGFTGRPAANVTVTVEASVTNLVNGVRPVGAGTVPAWPLAVLLTSPDDSVPSWTVQIENRQGVDVYGWDEENHRVTDGPDGLTEMVLVQQSGNQAANACLVDLNSGFDVDVLLRQFQSGWNKEDLADFNGEFSLANGPVDLSAQWTLSDLTEEDYSQLIGKARIILLYDTVQPEANNGSSVQITRLAAARLMAVNSTDGGLQLTIQAAVVATRTAIINEDAVYDGEAEGNPYLYKLSITQ